MLVHRMDEYKTRFTFHIPSVHFTNLSRLLLMDLTSTVHPYSYFYNHLYNNKYKIQLKKKNNKNKNLSLEPATRLHTCVSTEEEEKSLSIHPPIYIPQIYQFTVQQSELDIELGCVRKKEIAVCVHEADADLLWSAKPLNRQVV